MFWFLNESCDFIDQVYDGIEFLSLILRYHTDPDSFTSSLHFWAYNSRSTSVMKGSMEVPKILKKQSTLNFTGTPSKAQQSSASKKSIQTSMI